MKLEARGICKSYNRRKVVDDIHFEVAGGEVIALLGSNGAGKTTCFYMLVGMVRPDAGKIFYNDDDITDVPMYKRALMGIGYLPQENSIFRGLTVEENLTALLENLAVDQTEQNRRFDEAVDQMKIAHILGQKAYVLSGGERRRTEIARCLVLKPQFLLFDEPFAGVDPITIEELQEIIQELAGKGIGIILNDHNVSETLHISGRAYLMHRGKLISQGKPEEILENEFARKYYFGKRTVQFR